MRGWSSTCGGWSLPEQGRSLHSQADVLTNQSGRRDVEFPRLSMGRFQETSEM